MMEVAVIISFSTNIDRWIEEFPTNANQSATNLRIPVLKKEINYVLPKCMALDIIRIAKWLENKKSSLLMGT